MLYIIKKLQRKGSFYFSIIDILQQLIFWIKMYFYPLLPLVIPLTLLIDNIFLWNVGLLESMLIYCICTQYLVRAPFALITASIRRGMEVISLWHCSGDMEAQLALTVAFSSSAFFGLLFLIFLLTMLNRFSMGFRSGEFAGQSSTPTPWSFNQLLVLLKKKKKNFIFVTYTIMWPYNQQWDLCSAFNPSKCTHTWSSGQLTMWQPGSSWGFGALLKGLTSVPPGAEIRTHNLGLQVQRSIH